MKNLFILLIATLSLSSCATMFSSSKYYATVEVEGHADAKVAISRYGKVEQGEKVRLKRHGKTQITVRKDGCETITKTYDNTMNWAIVANAPLTLFLGTAIDAATGAMFSPKTGNEVFKEKNKHFNYLIQDYNEACKTSVTASNN